MFEKSLYDLIRGLRNHKGNEREYIQHSLKECRTEIKSPDMDLKTTALLKLIYLEMFGHDMSWASFHVLEVMSSAKYLQKRIGYLGAVQSFRPDTEVLMLATNLLKKDLMSPQPATISLPLVTLPHIITPSLALSLLSDLLPRLTHSQPAIRKKTIVTLYRLALVYPETLRPAWPKIKERLMDEQEDSSVTAAIVNVVCELGWRRPQDFLPLAPRLFDLLVDGGNNWMAIKIIKLFATLTPLEPRLVRKLLPPLTTLIRTTPAMSLLYECINGIIQGGILSSAEGTSEGEEIATLCVSKLRGMIAIEGDPNLKYVALLAFEKIVTSHPHLVALHHDVILDCIDDADISIRLRALQLVVGMVDSDNLESVVSRLMRQLSNSPDDTGETDPSNDRGLYNGVEPAADSEDEDPEETLRPIETKSNQSPPLPNDYRVDVINRIMEMCSKDNYSRIGDFIWYINILLQLTKLFPSTSASSKETNPHDDDSESEEVAHKIGSELRNVAVRVKSVRTDATRAAESLILSTDQLDVPSALGLGIVGYLGPAVWIVGEYSNLLSNPHDTLAAMLHPAVRQLRPDLLATYLQAIPKVFASITNNLEWTSERKSLTSLLIARINHFLESLINHPSLEVQERAVEILELMRLTAEAVSGQESDGSSAPLLLTQAIPSLFSGMELNPVAPAAQKKVPIPENLDLDKPINPDLINLLRDSELEDTDVGRQEQRRLYYERPTLPNPQMPAADRLEDPTDISYQQSIAEEQLDPQALAKVRAERRQRQKDDPFYIPYDGVSSTSTPLHNIIKSSDDDQLDIDSIPIMDLELGSKGRELPQRDGTSSKKKQKERQPVDIVADETLPGSGQSMPGNGSDDTLRTGRQTKGKKSLLQVDSSGLGGFSLEGDGGTQSMARTDAPEDDKEMMKAMKEVERLRLEMQRASERVEAAKGIPPGGTLVKKKKKKKKKADDKSKGKGKKKNSKSSTTEPAVSGESTPGLLEP